MSDEHGTLRQQPAPGAPASTGDLVHRGDVTTPPKGRSRRRFLQAAVIATAAAASGASAGLGRVTPGTPFRITTSRFVRSVISGGPTADLAVSKDVSSTTPNLGDTITFTVTVVNNGPDGATSVQVLDLLPAGLSFVSATASQGTYDAGTGLWDIGTVAVGSSPTLVIQTQVIAASTQTNTATISQRDQFDPDASNNSASVTVN
jgi:uncharacterized repeat protein (TIGR01451 family)